MTLTVVRRPARIAPPAVDGNTVVIAEPPKPQQTPPPAASMGMMMMPVMAGSSAVLVALTNQGRPLYAVGAFLVLIASIAFGATMIIGQRSGPRKQLRQSRERYLDYVDDTRQRVRSTIDAQRRSGSWRHPRPDALVDIARTPSRRWERRRRDPDYLSARVGIGVAPVASALRSDIDEGPLNEFDPVCLEAARSLRRNYATVSDQPVALDLAEVGVLSVVGDMTAARRLAQTLLAQLVTFHPPDDLQVAIARSSGTGPEWDWVKWLPHVQRADLMDGDLPMRLVASTVPGVFGLLRDDIELRLATRQRQRGQDPRIRRHTVVVVDAEGMPSISGFDLPEAASSLHELGLHVVYLLPSRSHEPDHVDHRVEVNADATAKVDGQEYGFSVDDPTQPVLRSLARTLSPFRLAVEDSPDVLTDTVDLPEILGVTDVAQLDPATKWRHRGVREFLRVPVGIGADGQPVMLDLKESAHSGMGPHGLVIGATGSGKSEMLRTLVTSLAISHPPERLALMLVDFKGGATFEGMRDLPHLAGMVTNLQDDLTLVDRMRQALEGEMQHRQEVLKAHGGLPNVDAYQTLREQGQPLEPLPHLLVIIDEFSELLTEKPDFADLFVAIGRIGRSIGVHLLLATQRLEVNKIRGLESHLSYRISLRTFSEAESREVIGVSDAYHLPPEPGSGYLKVDTTVFDRFKAAMVSAPYAPPATERHVIVPVLPYLATNGVGSMLGTAQRAAETRASGNGASSSGEQPGGRPVNPGERSVMAVAVDRLAGAGVRPARQIWLDPLPQALSLERVQAPEARAAAGTLSAVLGLVDDPAHQDQHPLEWDFTGTGGNLAVTGAPRSGKSILLRTMISSLALRYAPGEVAIYGVDYGGGSMLPLEGLPQVAAVATRADTERLRRTVAEVYASLDAREQLFRELGLDSIAAFRRARADGRVDPSIPADIFLVVDGWGDFTQDLDDLEPIVGTIASRGLAFGVHVVISVTQNIQIRIRTQSSFGGRIELRLNDAFDSLFGRKAMEELSKDSAGRGLIDGGLQFQTALPRVDARAQLDDLPEAQDRLIAAVRDKWPEGAVSAVRVLPQAVGYSELVDRCDARRVPVGLSELDLGPVTVDLFEGDPHLLVYGESESGKTNLLRVLLRGITASRSPDQVAIVLADARRGLMDAVPSEYLVAYGTSREHTRAVCEQLAGMVAERVPGPNVTLQQLRERSWWRGSHLVVVIDDFDLMFGGGANPLLPLLDYLPQGKDLGVHLVLCRRTGGAQRALSDPVMQRLSDLGTPGFLFSGDRTEGRLVNNVSSLRLPVGRALYVRRDGFAQQVQTAQE